MATITTVTGYVGFIGIDSDNPAYAWFSFEKWPTNDERSNDGAGRTWYRLERRNGSMDAESAWLRTLHSAHRAGIMVTVSCGEPLSEGFMQPGDNFPVVALRLVEEPMAGPVIEGELNPVIISRHDARGSVYEPAHCLENTL